MEIKKVYRFVACSLLGLLISCITLTTIICGIFTEKQYKKDCDVISDWIIEKIMLNDDYRTIEQKIYKISQAFSTNKDFEKDFLFSMFSDGSLSINNESFNNKLIKVAIFDQKGNLLLENGNTIFLGDVKCINLDSMMTDKACIELMKYKRRMNNKIIACYSIGYHRENQKIIVDEIYLYDKEQTATSRIDTTLINITERKPDNYFTVGENILSMDIFLNNNSFILLKSKANQLNRRINSSELKELAKWSTLEECNFVDKGYYDNGILKSSTFEGLYKIMIDKVPYTVDILINNSIILDVEKSKIFRMLIFIEFTICLIISVFVLMITGKLYEKSEMLKKSKEIFSNAVAHELKTPISIIQNQSECIMEGINPEKTFKYAESICEEANRMNKLIMSFLQYNRLNQLESIKFEKYSFSQIVNDEILKVQPLLRSKRILIENKIEDDLYIFCNQELLCIAVNNYITNAINYGDVGSIINIDALKNGKEYLFVVKNRCSKWVNDDNLWDINKKTEKISSELQSTGLGLPVTARILDLHKFKYEYNYDADSNTVTFSFLITSLGGVDL